MKKNNRCFWVSWVCPPIGKPYLGCIIADTKERAEAVFCDAYGKRGEMFVNDKIIHQQIEITIPAEVEEGFRKWERKIEAIKHIGEKMS